MLTRLEFQFPQAPKLEKLTENEKKLLQYVEDIKKSVGEVFRTLNRPDVLTIDQATIDDSAIDGAAITGSTVNSSVIGGTTAAAGTFTDLTSTGNTVLGNASTDTLNVGNGDITKDASGNTYIGPTNGFSEKLNVYGRISVGSGASGNDSEIRILNYASQTTAWNVAIRQDIGGANNDFKLVRFNSSGTYQDIPFQVAQADGIATFGNYIRAVDGSSTTPAYSFTNSTNSGMYLSSAGVVGFAAGGSAVFSYTNTGITMASGVPFSCAAAATGNASIKLPHGTAPSAPADGDMWTTTAGLYVRINGSTVGPLS